MSTASTPSGTSSCPGVGARYSAQDWGQPQVGELHTYCTLIFSKSVVKPEYSFHTAVASYRAALDKFEVWRTYQNQLRHYDNFIINVAVRGRSQHGR